MNWDAAFGWTSSVDGWVALFTLSILEIVLMETDASLLKLPLLKSGLCKQASCNIDIEITEVPLIIVAEPLDVSRVIFPVSTFSTYRSLSRT